MDGGETMKKIRLLIPLFIGLVAVTAYPAFARSSEEPVNVEEVNEANEDVGYFPGCDDDEKVIPLTQQEIATTLKCSKMKINSMFSILQKQDYIEQKTRGKYVLTDKAENIIETIETLQ